MAVIVHTWFVRKTVEGEGAAGGSWRFVPACACGWVGPADPMERYAAEAALSHVRSAASAVPSA